MNTTNRDVVVIGGGPVGLWVACELKLAGLDVAVVERRTERVNQSRALTIHGRTLEVFSLRGLEERFLAHGKPIPTGHFGVLDTRLDFSAFETRFPYTLFIPQARTEALIEERALELGVCILRGHIVEAVEPNANEVAVKGTHDGVPFKISGRFAVGADGARSLTRAAAGIDFPGYPPTKTYALGDVRLDMPPDQPVISTVNGKGCIMVAPLGDGVHHRIVLLDLHRWSVPATEPLTLEELAVSARGVLGADLNPREPIWLSRFTDETRMADAYRAGNILLAGDAGHMHLPAGGQGMNVGIQDAMNLGWKLAAVLKGDAPDALLESYEAERRPIGMRLFNNTLAQASLISSVDPAGLALRQVMNDFLRLPSLNAHIAAELSGFGIAYPEPLLSSDTTVGKTDGAAGIRIADCDLQLADGSSASLYSFLAQGKWLHLSLADELEANLPAWLDRSAVTFIEGRTVGAGGLHGIAALLIRPDGYAAASKAASVKDRTVNAVVDSLTTVGID